MINILGYEKHLIDIEQCFDHGSAENVAQSTK